MGGYHKDFRDQRHKRRHRDYCEKKCEDGYISYYDDSSRDRYDQIRGRSREKDYLCDDDVIFHSKMESIHKILQTMSQEKEITIGFMLMFSENPDKILDNIHSPADVDQLIAERIEYAKIQKAEDLAKDPQVNVSSISSQNYESINADLDLTQESVDTEYIEESNSNSNREEEIQFLDLGECEIIGWIRFAGTRTTTTHNISLENGKHTHCNTYRKASSRRVYVRRGNKFSGYR